MNINPFSHVSPQHPSADQSHPANPENNTRLEPSTSRVPFLPPRSSSLEKLQSLNVNMKHIRVGSRSTPTRAPATGATTSFVNLNADIQCFIVQKAAITGDAEESAKNLARLARVNKTFQKLSQDIQESRPDIKKAGERAQARVRKERREAQKRVMGEINGILHSSAAPLHEIKEQVKTLLATEPHVGVELGILHKNGSHYSCLLTDLLLEILKEKKDIESLRLEIFARANGYCPGYILKKLKEIKANNSKLHDIGLNWSHGNFSIYKEDMEELIEALNDKNKPLSSLDLLACPTETHYIQMLAEALKNNSGLQFLNLAFTKLDIATVEALARALEENTTLQFLNLRGTRVDDGCAQVLAEALKKNKTLKSLDLALNKFVSDGPEALAEALKNNSGLQSLDLSCAKLDIAGVKALARALEENTMLQSLVLSETGLDDGCAQVLAEALKKNKTLKFLDLTQNKFVSDGPVALANALKENTTLELLELKGALIEYRARSLLESAIAKTTKSGFAVRIDMAQS